MAQAALAGAGGLMGAASSISEGQSEYVAGEYNARVAEQNARQVRLQTAEEARRQTVSADKQLGDIRASYGASGVVSSEGSALDVLQESAATAALDNLTIKHAGELRARGFESEARVSRMRGEAARRSGYFKAASSLLSAGSDVAGKVGTKSGTSSASPRGLGTSFAGRRGSSLSEYG